MATRLIGLDPGLRRTGWGVIEVEGNSLFHVASGAVTSTAALPLAERLSQLYEALAAADRPRPHEAAVEETFVNKNLLHPETRAGPRRGDACARAGRHPGGGIFGKPD